MKRPLALLLALMMIVSVFVGCGDTNEPPAPDGSGDATDNGGNGGSDNNGDGSDNGGGSAGGNDGEGGFDDGEYGDEEQHEEWTFAYSEDRKTAIIVRYFNLNEDYNDLVIPSKTEDGATIVGIYDWAFKYCYLKNITVPDTVTKIGMEAFNEELKTITLPSSITSISESMFKGCSSLTSITIPSSVTSIGNYAFEECSSLTSITIPSSVTSLGKSAFVGCESLKSVTLHNNIKRIEAFSGCASLESITFEGDKAATCYPDSYFELGNCPSLTSITIPGWFEKVRISSSTLTSLVVEEGVKYIEGLNGCPNLSSIVLPDSIVGLRFEDLNQTSYYNNKENWENGVLYISNHLVKADEDISGEYTIKPGTVSIGEYAFASCVNLTNVIIPDSMVNIGYSAFNRCTGLNAIDIPDSVTSIADGAFYGCSKLKTVKLSKNITKIGSNTFGSCGVSSITIPDGVTEIEREAFKWSGLVSITLPDSVKIIDYDAFREAYGLSEINLPDGITYIGDAAFLGTSYYEDDRNWQDGVLYIGNYLIKAKDVASSYEIAQGTTLIADSAFYYRENLKNITIPNTVKYICDKAFAWCSLENVVIPDSVVSINREAFACCKLMTSVTLSKNLQYLGYGVFSACNSLTKIELPDGLNTLDGTFAYCEWLTQITIPDSVTEIGDETFLDCKNLASITLSKGLKTIGEDAFTGCTSLSSIVLPEGLTSICEDAFRNCTALTSITFPNSITSLEDELFGGYELEQTMNVYVDDLETWYKLAYGFDCRYQLYINGEIMKTSFELTYDMTADEIAALPIWCLTSVKVQVGMENYVHLVAGGTIKDIYYGGTIEEWDLFYGISGGRSFTVHCTDGDIQSW